MVMCPCCDEEVEFLTSYCVCCGLPFQLDSVDKKDLAEREVAYKDIFGDTCSKESHTVFARTDGCNNCPVCGDELFMFLLSH